MTAIAWLSLLAGLVIGGGYGALQGWDDHRAQMAGRPLRLLGAAARLGLLVVALLIVGLAGANKYWLAGGVAISYSVALVWRLKQLMARKK